MPEQINFITAVALVIVMVGGVVAVGIATGFPAAVWFGNRLGEILSCLPRERFAIAPPALGIGAAKAVRGDFAGAVETYEAMLFDHPRDREIYIRLLEIHFGPLHQPERGDALLQQALLQLEDENDRRVLNHLALALKNGTRRPYRYLDPRPDPGPAAPTPPPLTHP